VAIGPLAVTWFE